MGQQVHVLDTERSQDRLDRISLTEQRIRAVGLRRQAVSGHVEQHNPPSLSQPGQDTRKIDRRRRKPVQHQERRRAARGLGGGIHDEDVVVPRPHVGAHCGPTLDE